MAMIILLLLKVAPFITHDYGTPMPSIASTQNNTFIHSFIRSDNRQSPFLLLFLPQ